MFVYFCIKNVYLIHTIRKCLRIYLNDLSDVMCHNLVLNYNKNSIILYYTFVVLNEIINHQYIQHTPLATTIP